MGRPGDWVEWVNRPIEPGELQALAECERRRGRPYGDGRWQGRMVARLGLQHTVRSRGRPKKHEDEAQRAIEVRPVTSTMCSAMVREGCTHSSST